MQILRTRAELLGFSLERQQRGQRIALVPTMGNLHAGHLSLVKAAGEDAACVIVSLFVNPTQFGPKEDFQHYPRTEADDVERLRELNVDAVFIPAVEEMYPSEMMSTVAVPDLSERLEGQSRPGHFQGVATIVLKLLHLSRANTLWLGRKDYQQWRLLQRMVEDLDLPCEVLAGPTVRESDGLAMSSRNQYLNPSERQKAPVLHSALQQVASRIEAGERDWLVLQRAAEQMLREAGLEPDYLQVCEAESLQPAAQNSSLLVILAAARMGTTRLLDNVEVNILSA